MRLKGKTALIAGGGRNNGRAIALTFAREGADLILVAKQRAETLNQVARECEGLGARVVSVLADLGDANEVDKVVKLGLERFGKVDVLVSAIGIRPHKHFWEFSNEEWLQGFAMNLHSIFYLAKALVPGMIERKNGSIIVLGGQASLTAPTIDPLGITTKHGAYGFIKTMALELGPHNVRANLLALSFIDNERRNPEWYAGFNNRSSKEFERTPLRRTGKPEEVANAALFLASDASSYITGDRLCCMGGRYM